MRSPARAAGFTCPETAVAMGLMGILAAAGLASVRLDRQDLSMVAREFQGSLTEAFLLARARGRSVVVSLGCQGDPALVQVRLPAGVSWGKPPGVPLPGGMQDPVCADTTGRAHDRITVTPWRTTAASAWFAQDGHDVICLRLSGHGHLQVLRWRERTRQWSRE